MKNMIWEGFIERKEETFVRENLDWYSYYQGKAFIDDAYASVGKSLLDLFMLLPEILLAGVGAGGSTGAAKSMVAAMNSGGTITAGGTLSGAVAGANVVAVPILVAGGTVMVQGSIMQAEGSSRGELNRKKAEKGSETEYKKPVSGKSGKEAAKDVPSWAKGNKPYKNESGNEFATRLMDEKYGKGNYPKGPGTEYNKIRKWGDRGFE